MINVFGIKIIVTIGNNDKTHLSFEEFFPEVGYKLVEEAKDEFERG